MPMLTMVLLLVLFVGILIWAFRPKNRRRFEKDAEIPFHSKDGSDDHDQRP